MIRQENHEIYDEGENQDNEGEEQEDDMMA